MGIGDQVMAAGRAKLLHKKTGKRVCIGNRPNLLWSPLYSDNPYLVKSGEKASDDQIWLHDCPGARPYIDYQGTRLHSDNRRMSGKRFRRWVWMKNHVPEPMEVFFSEEEEYERDLLKKRRFILVNPHQKPKAPPNKRWPFEYFQEVVNSLKDDHEIIQLKEHHGQPSLLNATSYAPTLRQLAVYISSAVLVVSGEGLFHHLSAAFQTPTVVLFGGFVSPDVTGYDYQQSIYVRDRNVLGVREATEAGRNIMLSITPELVLNLAEDLL